VAFSPSGSHLASVGDDELVKVWDLTSGQAACTCKGHRDGINCVAFSPDGRRLASAGHEKTVRLWDATTGQELLTLAGHTSGVDCLAFRPDGQVLASGSSLYRDRSGKTHPSQLKVWDLTTGKEGVTVTLPSSIFSLAFSPDGHRIFTPGGGKKGEVTIWDATTGEELAHCGTVARRGVDYLALSPNGKRIATDGGRGTIQLWDAGTGRDLLTLRGHADRLTGLAFSPDGRRLASASSDRTIRVWDGTPPAQRREPGGDRGP
jgi:WD40 repeat protein